MRSNEIQSGFAQHPLAVALLLILASSVTGADDEKKAAGPKGKIIRPADKPMSLSASAAADMPELAKEKAARTPAQKKLDSHIVLALKKSRGEPPFDKPNSIPTDLAVQPDGRVLVDIEAMVTKELREHVANTGGEIISSFPASRALRALVPLTRMEELAGRADVKFIAPASVPLSNSVGNKPATTGNRNGSGNDTSSPRSPDVPQSQPLISKP